MLFGFVLAVNSFFVCLQCPQRAGVFAEGIAAGAAVHCHLRHIALDARTAPEQPRGLISPGGRPQCQTRTRWRGQLTPAPLMLRVLLSAWTRKCSSSGWHCARPRRTSCTRADAWHWGRPTHGPHRWWGFRAAAHALLCRRGCSPSSSQPAAAGGWLRICTACRAI